MSDVSVTEKKQFELLTVRMIPHGLRDDFITVGVVLVEPDGEFASARFTRDWKRVECFAPDLELEIFEYLEKAVESQLKGIRGRRQLVQLLEQRFGTLFDVGPEKGLVAEDPAIEMKILVRDYLEPMRPMERARRLGRMGIVGRMELAFEDAGLTGLLQREIEMKEFTGENDPFRVDFGFRVGKSLRMFQGLALSLSREPAVTLAYRYLRIQEGMKKKNEEALLTAVISDQAARAKGEVGSGIAMLRANDVSVRSLEEMPEIAEEARKELQG